MPRGDRVYRKATAYHETGHALAALKEGRQVKGIYIHATNPNAGACLYRPSIKNSYDPSMSSGDAAAAWQHTYEHSCADIRIGLAGPLAEAKFLGKPLRALGSKSDLDSCIYQVERLARLRFFMAEYFEVKQFDPEQILEAEKRRIHRWLARHEIWSALMLVSYALFHKGEISGPVLNNVIGVASALRSGQMPLNFG